MLAVMARGMPPLVRMPAAESDRIPVVIGLKTLRFRNDTSGETYRTVGLVRFEIHLSRVPLDLAPSWGENRRHIRAWLMGTEEVPLMRLWEFLFGEGRQART